MAHPRDVVLIDGTRTPFAKSGTKFNDIHASELGKSAMKELIARTTLDVTQVDEVIMGNTGSPADAVNISRVCALGAGVPQKVSMHTVHRNCASALESIATGFDKIKAGMADVVIAGGTESMSQMPMIMPKTFVKAFSKLAGAKSPGQQLGALMGLFKADMNQIKELMTTAPMAETPYKPIISIVKGLTDPFVGINMGNTAEILAKEFHLTREEQDQFAVRSHQKAVEATKAGRMAEEIVPFFMPPKYAEAITSDIGPRDGQSMEQLAKLKPFFDRKYGTVTVGNACPITDGAATVLMMSREKAEALGYKPKFVVRSYGFAGLEPERMGLGPVYSTPVALKRAGLQLKDMGLIELNEAFAAQVLACKKAMESDKFGQEKLGLSSKLGEIDMDKLNVNGGAIAIGHPVGATGTRLVVTLMKEMARRNTQFGLATLCIGGGQGGSMIIEQVN
jgi:acetyl-CoA acyltransferase